MRRTGKTQIRGALLAFALFAASAASAQPSAPAAPEGAPVIALPATQGDIAAGAASLPATNGEAPGSPATKEAFHYAMPTRNIGQPDGRIALQTQVTEIGRDASWMHDVVLMPLMTATCLLVLGLILWVVVRYRRAANPVPSRTSHNTVVEIIWTLAPVAVLVVIAVPSISLLAKQYSPPKADLTVKVIGNQWYWTYQYPDNGDFEIVSNMLKEKVQVRAGERARTDADGPRLLAVDERMVVPAGRVIKVITTSADVIHSFAMPAFWTKMDAVPGRLNETWFKVDRPGVYFGQCSELCGARHPFMPIAVEVVPEPVFNAWLASKGGHPRGRADAANPDATKATSPATSAAPAVAATAEGERTAVPTQPVTTHPIQTTQGASADEGTQ